MIYKDLFIKSDMIKNDIRLGDSESRCEKYDAGLYKTLYVGYRTVTQTVTLRKVPFLNMCEVGGVFSLGMCSCQELFGLCSWSKCLGG